MAATKEATVIILDIGKSTHSTSKPDEKSFFDQAKVCVEKILHRKIFSQPKDEVALILMGSDVTRNQLNTDLGGYEQISEAFDLSMTNWQMLRILEKEVQPGQCESDWLDAIVVSLDLMKRHLERKFKIFKIVLLTPFLVDVNDENVNIVIAQLQNLEVELVVITDKVRYIPDCNDTEDLDDEALFNEVAGKTIEAEHSEDVVSNLIHATGGALCDFDQAMVQLIYFEKKKQKTMAWSVDLEIASKLKIKVSAYINIKDPGLLTWKTDSSEGNAKTKTEYFLDEKILSQERIETMIKGYMYGSTPVAYDPSLGMSINAGGKSLQCIGFTDQNLIKDEYLEGSCIWAIVSQTGFEVSEKMLLGLITQMKAANMAMVARYVYRAGCKPKLMALFPNESRVPYKNAASLSMIELYFADNHVFFTMPPLKTNRTQPTSEQYDAIDKLIDSMDLMDSVDNPSGHKIEAFANKKILNPTLQHTYRLISAKALHPMQPLPLPEQDLVEMFNIPKKLSDQSAEQISNIKEKFELERIEKPTKERLFAKLQKISSATETNSSVIDSTDDDQTNLVEVRTVTPAEDFIELLRRGEKFVTLGQQLQNVVGELVFRTVILQAEKVAKAIMIYREESKLLGSFRYNQWIEEFKLMLLQRNKLDVWDKIIVAEKFGLISASESETSTVTDEEALDFYNVHSGGLATTLASMMDDDGDVDDLIGNM